MTKRAAGVAGAAGMVAEGQCSVLFVNPDDDANISPAMRVTSTFPLLIVLLLAAACARSGAQQPYDLLITGGSVLNGEGTPAVQADVGIRGGRIAAIGDLQTATAAHRIDASGLTVAPGFIDMHNHSDYTILVEPGSESMIRQGVTTMVLGESRSAGPIKAGADEARARADGVTVDWTTLGGYFAKLEKQHTSTNIASYVGEEQVWTYVKGYGQSPATPAELDEMKRLIAQAMEEGAMGVSTSLLQPPSSLATTTDLIELAKTAKQYGGIYSSHIRDEGEGCLPRHRRSDPGGQGRGIPVDVIHMKIAHKQLWGRGERDHRDGPEGARRGPRRPRQRLPVHGRAEQSVVNRAAVGA